MKIRTKIFINKFGLETYQNFKKNKYYKRKIKNGGYFSNGGIDRRLEELLLHRSGYYVELGAHDGAYSSNSYYFELRKGWKRVLIEPSPNLYLSCKKRRSAENYFRCPACVPFEYVDDFVPMEYADAMTTSPGLNLELNDAEQFKKARTKNLQSKEEIFKFAAKAETLTSILNDARAPKIIDFLSLDVEGAELDVLKGVDFFSYQFKYMVIETRNIYAMSNYLKKFNYHIFEKLTDIDFIFSHESVSK